LDGLEFMHNRGYAHRDIKMENLLLNKDFDLKIADFGFATDLKGKDGTGFLHENIGTPSYMAPEILLDQPYKGATVDIFASAVVLFQMVSKN